MEYRVNDSRYHLQAGGGPLLQLQRPSHAGSPAPRPGTATTCSPHLPPPAAPGPSRAACWGPQIRGTPLVEQPGALSSARPHPGGGTGRPAFLRELAAILRLSRKKGGALRAGGPSGGLLENLGPSCTRGFGGGRPPRTPGEDPGKSSAASGRSSPFLPPALPGEGSPWRRVARQVGLCKSECCRFFKRQMGRAPVSTTCWDYRVGKKPGAAPVRLHRGRKAAPSRDFPPRPYFSKVFRARDRPFPQRVPPGETEGRIKYGTGPHFFQQGPQGTSPWPPAMRPPHLRGNSWASGPPAGGGQGPPARLIEEGPGVLHDLLGPAGGWGKTTLAPHHRRAQPAPTSSTSAPSPAASKRSKR